MVKNNKYCIVLVVFILIFGLEGCKKKQKTEIGGVDPIPKGLEIKIKGDSPDPEKTTSRQVLLSFKAIDDEGVYAYYISEDKGFPEKNISFWNIVKTLPRKNLELEDIVFEITSGDGEKKIYVWFMDADGNISISPVYDSITLVSDGSVIPTVSLDTEAPSELSLTVKEGDTVYSEKINLLISGKDNFGVSAYYISEGSSMDSIDPAGWKEVTPPAKSFQTDINDYYLTTGTGQKTLTLWLKDGAGNISQPVQSAVNLLSNDTRPPSGASLIINPDSEGETVYGDQVTLRLAAVDNQAGDSGVAAYCITEKRAESDHGPEKDDCVDIFPPQREFSQDVQYAFPQNENSFGERTIYVWFWDANDNVSVMAASGRVNLAAPLSWTSPDLINYAEPSDPVVSLVGFGPDDIWALKKSGRILNNRGGWNETILTDNVNLTALWGAGKDNLYAVGAAGTILHYGESGWISLDSQVMNQTFYAVWGTDDRNFYAVGSGGTMVHYDGSIGTKMAIPTFEDIYAVWGSGAGDIYAAGANGVVIHSNDGIIWEPVYAIDLYGTNLYAVWGTGPADVYVGGSFGTVLHYDGDVWNYINLPGDFTVKAIWGTAGKVYAGGLSGKTAWHDGSDWNIISSGTTRDINTVWGWEDGSRIYFGANNILEKNGSDWNVDYKGSGSEDYTGIWVVNEGGEEKIFIGTGEGKIYRFRPGYGLGLDMMNTGVTLSINGIWGLGENDLYAVGNDGLVLHYDGNTDNAWTPMDSGSGENLNAIWGTADGRLYAVGDKGTLLKNDLSGWLPDTSLTTGKNLLGIWGKDTDNIYVVGEKGALFIFKDNTWTEIETGRSEDLRKIWGTGKDIFLINGEKTLSRLRHTTAGISLEAMDIGAAGKINSVWGLSPTDIFVVGSEEAFLIGR